jgi:hypothetical protein
MTHTQVDASQCRIRVCRDCCCGSLHKHPGIDHGALIDELIERTLGHATVDVTACLLSCDRSNVVVIVPSAQGRLLGAGPAWFEQVLDLQAVEMLADFVRAGGPGLVEPGSQLTRLACSPRSSGDASAATS